MHDKEIADLQNDHLQQRKLLRDDIEKAFWKGKGNRPGAAGPKKVSFHLKSFSKVTELNAGDGRGKRPGAAGTERVSFFLSKILALAIL